MARIYSLAILFFFLLPSLVISLIFSRQFESIILLFLTLWTFPFLFLKSEYRFNHQFSESRTKFLLKFLTLFYLICSFKYLIDLFVSIGNGQIGIWLIENTLNRYDNTETMPFIDRIRFIIMFSIASLSIMLFISTGRNKVLIPFIFVIIIELLALARAGILLSLIWGLLSAVFLSGQHFVIFSLKKLLRFCLKFSILGLIFFLTTSYLRVSNEEEIFPILKIKFDEYIAAPIYLMAESWRITEVPLLPEGFGKNTFTAILKFFGVRLEAGVYPYVETPLGETVIRGSIFGLMIDFGYVFTIIFLILLPIILYVSDKENLSINIRFIQVVVLYIICYPIISPYIYVNIIFAVLLNYLCIRYILYRTIQ